MNRLAAIILLAWAPLAGGQSPSPSAEKSPAKQSADEAHRSDDIAKHRQMARAHEEAARCLEAGTAEKQCKERLREACKGIAVGQYCGMRHAH
jgi:hypothetical protein